MKKVLIIRQSAIGDIVFASPFASALKRTWPDCHVTWLVEPGNQALIADAPAVDECLVVPGGEWRQSWRNGHKLNAIRQMLAFGKTLEARHFDVAIDLQGLLKSGMMAWLSRAPRRIGLGSREGSRLLMTEVYPRAGQVGRIGSEYLYLAEKLGFDVGAFVPELTLNPAAEQAALARLARLNLEPGRYVVFAAFTTRPQKHWVNTGWRAMAEKINATGMTPLLLGGPAESEAATAIVAQAPMLVNLVGQTPLNESVALIAHAGGLIGVDTGLTHMGIAFNIPTVALFGSTCPYRDTRRSNARVIWLGLPCSPCRRRPTCNGQWTCLADIKPDRVMAEWQAVSGETS